LSFILRRYFVSVREPSLQTESWLRIFTLEIDGQPILAFEATGLMEAREISLYADLRTDLNALTSEGIPICVEGSTLVARPAVQDEIAAFKRAVEMAPASDEPTMAFLIKIDAIVVVTAGHLPSTTAACLRSPPNAYAFVILRQERDSGRR
jgi:hypothetical protein